MSRIVPLDAATADERQREPAGDGEVGARRNPEHDDHDGPLSGARGLARVNAALRKGAISGADAERIALGVAEENTCSYCLSAHSYLAANLARLGPEERERSRHFDSADPQSARILAFARAVLDGRGEVGDQEFQAARDAGLTDAQLSETVGHVAINVLTNYFNKAFRVEVDFPLVEAHQHAEV